MLALFVVLGVLALKWPAELGPQADPASDYLARPPWYFLPLFQLLKYFPGKLSLLPTVLLPGALFTALFALPFLDRRSERHPYRRPLATLLLLVVLAGAGGLIVLSKQQDRTDPEIGKKLKEQEEEAQDLLVAPFEPQEVRSAAVVSPPTVSSSPPVMPASLPAPPEAFINECADCHGNSGEGIEGEDTGPSLIGVTTKPRRTREDLLRILERPRRYGLKKPMPGSFPELTAEEKQQIVEWLEKLK